MRLSRSVLGGITAAIGVISLVASAPSPAHAAVFTVDTKLGEDTLSSSSDAAEKDALADFIDGTGGIQGSDLTLVSSSESPTVQTDDVGNFFLDVAPEEPSWFVLKFGVGQTGTASHYFFANIAELTKLVWTATQVNNLSIEALSHYRAFVPLPAAALFLLTALAGLFGVRRWSRREETASA